jgi:hypothetical protein
VTLRARWVTLRARWVTLRARWVTLRARWVTYSDAKVANRNVRHFGWEMSSRGRFATPAGTVYTIVDRTEGYTYAAKAWDLSIVRSRALAWDLDDAKGSLGGVHRGPRRRFPPRRPTGRSRARTAPCRWRPRYETRLQPLLMLGPY